MVESEALRQNESPRNPLMSAAYAFLCVVVFVVPLFVWPGASDYGYAKSIFMFVAVSILTLLWIASAVRREALTARVPWLAVPAAALVAAALLSLLHATSDRVVIQSLVLALFFAQFALLTLNLVHTRRQVHFVLWLLLLSGALAAVYGLLQYANIAPGVGQVGAKNVISTMGNRDAIGGFLAYIAFPCAILVFRRGKPWLRIAALLGVLFCLTVSLLVQQTGVTVSLAVSVPVIGVLWLIAHPRRVLRRTGLALLAAVLVLGGVYTAFSLLSAQRSRFGIEQLWAENSGSERTYYWSVGWEMLRDQPWTGVGLGNYKLTFMKYETALRARGETSSFSPYGPDAAQAHNDYLQFAAELGVPGVLAMIALLGTLAGGLWVRLRREWERENARDLVLLSGGLVVFLLHAIVAFPVHLASSAFAAVLLTGLAFSPTYGSAAVRVLNLRRGLVRWILLPAALLIGVCVSTVAIRDLVANTLQLKGTREILQGEPGRALPALEKSLSLDFAPRETYFRLASAQYALGEYDQALESLRRCLTVFPDENAFLLYADLAAGQGQLDTAMATLDELLSARLSQDHAWKARYVRALILRAEGKTDALISALEALIADAPNYEPAYITLGDTYRSLDRNSDARKEYEAALTAIDANLAELAAKLDRRSTYELEESIRIRDRISALQSEQEAVRQRLEDLPSP
jgi:O-antigen ligase/tetratricopeptide (TPR) repeat protein